VARLTISIYIQRLKKCLPYYDVVNLVTVTKMNMIRRNTLWLCKNHCCESTAQCLPHSCAAVSAALEVSGTAALEVSPGSAQRSEELQYLTIL
jgi:lipid A disaccharide synthetase